MRLVTLAITLVLSRAGGEAYVDCDGGSDSNPCTKTRPCKTLSKAVGVDTNVWVYASVTNRCELSEPLSVPSGVSINSMFDIVTISGGRSLSGSLFEPVSNYPSIAAQITSPSARAAAMVVNLRTNLPNVPFGWPRNHYYIGGSGCILPGRLESTMMRFFLGQDWQPSAQYPDDDVNVHTLTKISAVDSNRFIQPASDMQARMARWEAQFASPLPDVQARGWWNGIGWAVSTLNVTSFRAPAGSTPGALQIAPGVADESNPKTGGYFSVLNVLAELSQPGEWHLNRTSGNLVVFPLPGGIPGSSRAPVPESQGPATVSVLDDAIIKVADASNVWIENVRIAYGNGPGLSVVNSTDVTCLGCTIENVGMMAVNVTGGARVSVQDSEVGATGSGGVFLSGGDRQTLVPGNHSIVGTKVHGFSRITQSYAPGVYLEGVGNVADGVELYDASHECLYFQGNNHLLSGSDIHDCVQKTRDAGAVYAGRDWSARGNVIRSTSFHDIDTHQDGPGGDVHAVYLDDSFSGLTVTNCTFHNVSSAFLLGGGRDNVFLGNSITNTTSSGSPVLFDDRDEGWAKPACEPGGILRQLLAAVPYNTSEVWKRSYPDLVNILNDNPCLPKYNHISNNTYCGIRGTAFIDESAATIAKWGSFATNNVEQC